MTLTLSLSWHVFVLTGCGLKMRKLELEKKVLAYFPMPNQELKSVLQESWLKYCKSLSPPHHQAFTLCCDFITRLYIVLSCLC